MEAMPTPIPATNLEKMKKSLVLEKAIAREEIKNKAAAANKPGFRPQRSAILPADKQPTMQPNASDAVAKPSQYSLRLNLSFKKGKAPAITAKSNPNKYPPSAEINEIASTKLRFGTIVFSFIWQKSCVTKMLLPKVRNNGRKYADDGYYY